MAVTYPLPLPAAFKSAKVTVAAENVIGVSSGAYDLSEQVYEYPGKRWHLTIQCPAMSTANAEQIIGWLLALNGRAGTFYCNDTSHRTAFGIATGAPQTNGVQTAMSTDLVTNGWTPSTNGIICAGDWLQVGTGSTMRLHKAVYNPATGSGSWNSDSGGNCTITVWPRLRGAYAASTPIVTANASGIFMLKSDPSWEIDLQRVYGLTIAGVEVLQLN